MAIQQNFPDEGPTLNLNFAGSRTLDPRITFTRTSSATVMGREGLIEVVPANTPRFDHRYVNGEIESLGLLIEEQRSNLITYSEALNDAWSPINVSIGINSTTSPDGNQTADLFIPDSLGSPGYIGISRNGVGVSTNTSYTVSAFIKDGGYDNIIIFIDSLNTSGGNRTGALYRMTGVAGTSFSNSSLNTANDTTTTHSIEKYPNDWYRVRLSFTVGDSTAISVNLRYTNDSVGYVNSNGDGSSGIYIWGVQLEQGAFPTSYIPTTNSTATRTADNAKMEGSNFSSWYNPSEGSIFMEYQINSLTQFIPTVTGNSTHYIFMDDLSTEQSTFNKIQQFSSITSTQNRLQVDGTSYSPAAFSPPQEKTTNICGMAYKLGTSQVAAYSNNNISFTTAPSMPNNLSQLRLGASNDPIDRLNGTISYFTYYPVRLSNSQLQTLTK